MTDIRDDLKERFSDGEIPRGADFAALIDAFALDDALQAHVADFAAFLPDGNRAVVLDHEVEPGAPVSWSIGVGDRGALRLDRSATASRPTVIVGAWAGSTARFGTWKSGTEPFDIDEDRTLPEPQRSMSFADADGSWKTIIPRQGGAHAAEIVAYVDGVPDAGRPVTTILEDLFWPRPPVEAICHAIVSCREQGGRPHIGFTGDPYKPQWFHGWPVLLMPVPLILTLVGLYFVAVMIFTPSFWGMLFGAVGLVALALAVRIYRLDWTRRRGVQLRWHVMHGARWRGTAEHSLQIRAGPFPGKTDPRIRYHVTRLWE